MPNHFHLVIYTNYSDNLSKDIALNTSTIANTVVKNADEKEFEGKDEIKKDINS